MIEEKNSENIEEKIDPVDQNNYLDYSFDRKVDGWLQKPYELFDIEQDSVTDYFINLREEYLKADEEFTGADKEKILNKYKRHIGEVRSRYDDSIELRDHISLINNSPDHQGANWINFKRSKMGQELSGIMSGEKELTWKGDFAGYEIDGKFMSTYDIRKMVDEKTFDKPSMDLIGSVIEYATVVGSYKGAGPLNMKDVEFKIKSEVIDKGNRESLVNDTHIQTEGGSFKVDMINRLQEMTYGDLGISQDMIQNIDDKMSSVKISDGINRDEAIIITEELLKNKELTDEYLTKYFAQHVKNHYDHLYAPQTQMNNSQYEQMLKNKNAYGKGSSTPQTQQAAEKYKKGSL